MLGALDQSISGPGNQIPVPSGISAVVVNQYSLGKNILHNSSGKNILGKIFDTKDFTVVEECSNCVDTQSALLLLKEEVQKQTIEITNLRAILSTFTGDISITSSVSTDKIQSSVQNSFHTEAEEHSGQHSKEHSGHFPHSTGDEEYPSPASHSIKAETTTIGTNSEYCTDIDTPKFSEVNKIYKSKSTAISFREIVSPKLTATPSKIGRAHV